MNITWRNSCQYDGLMFKQIYTQTHPHITSQILRKNLREFTVPFSKENNRYDEFIKGNGNKA